jgi:hypothetical protein
MWMTIYQSTRRNIAEDLNFQEDLYVLFFWFTEFLLRSGNMKAFR